MTNIHEIHTVFNKVYERNQWGSGSGYGSSLSATKKYRRIVSNFLQKNGIGSVVELGCGDFQIMNQILSDDMSYVGYDVASDVIVNNRIDFGTDNWKFDVLSDYSLLASAPLLICKDVLQHLPTEISQFIIREIFPRYEHVLVTNCVGHRKATKKNENVYPGSFTNLDVLSAPFSVSGEVLLEWNAPLRSILFPVISIRYIVRAPFVCAAYIKMILRAYLSGDYENHPRWRKHLVYVKNF
jgi:hypothetical protein